tara:strand:- start:526 stop:1476 length:951 start_codon:yes stop_codon:yes gene_type:complete
MDLEKKVTVKNLQNNFEKNFYKILPFFYEMQTTFLSGIYKRYGDLEGGQIVIYFARDLHLRVMRKREEDLNFDLSLEKFWFNHHNTPQNQHKIIAVARYTGLPKETARRKILLLTKDKHLKKTSKNKLYWEPASQYKETYVTIIKEQINSLSKFLYEQSKCLSMDIPFNKFYKEIEKNYCFYWYHYLNAQLEYMKFWQLKTKDLEILLIGLQSLIQSFNYFKLKSNKGLGGPSVVYPDISATSVSEVTGIPRATCIRKLEWLCKAKFIKKDLENKRYHLLHDKFTENILNHPLANIKATVEIFTEFSLIIYRSLLR